MSLISKDGWDLLTYEDVGTDQFLVDYQYTYDVRYTGTDPNGKRFVGAAMVSKDLLNDPDAREALYQMALDVAIEELLNEVAK